MVTLAAPWSNNLPYIDGHGNWGSSVDSAAASRYTEAKLSSFSWDCLVCDSDTWETVPNYDGTLQEPAQFNVKVPAVLLNGQEGIGVGWATRIAPHSLRSIVAATKLACKLNTSDKERIANLEKARQVLIPDFPSGCEIVNDDQLAAYTQTGSGSIRCRARVEAGVQKRDGRAKDRATVTFTNLPPGANPERLGEQIKSELERGRLENIA
jgi:DNA gyrase subunit A